MYVHLSKGSLNDSCFDQESVDEAESGMYLEGEDIFGPSTVLFKFVKSALKKDVDYSLTSPWWFEEAILRLVLTDARESQHFKNHTLGVASSIQASHSAGLSQSWKKAGSNYILAGRVESLTRCYYGRPKLVGAADKVSKKEISKINQGNFNQNKIGGLTSSLGSVGHIEVYPDPRCKQLFIPGLKKIELIKLINRPIDLNNDQNLDRGEIEVFIRGLKSLKS